MLAAPRRLPDRRPRLVATDLDGTLLRSDGTVSERTRRALGAAEAAGIEVVCVTARPPRWLGPLSDVVGGHGKVVCLGGAAVWDLATGRALDVQGFADDDAAALVADLRAVVPGVGLVLERVDGPSFDPGFDWLESVPGTDRVPVEHTLRQGRPAVSKILARLRLTASAADAGDGPAVTPRAASSAEEEFFAAVRSAAGQRATLAYSGAAGLAELLAPGVAKDTALARWCAREGIAAADVWAFGDMPNDLPMLRWAGRGIAVANAHLEVLAAADAVVASNDDDGVARAIEDLLTG